MTYRSLLPSMLVLLLALCAPLAAAPTPKPATNPKRADLLKSGLKHFQLQLTYAPPANEPDDARRFRAYSLVLAVDLSVLQRAAASPWEKLAPVDEPEAAKIIDELSRDGILDAAQDLSQNTAAPAPPYAPGYSLTILADNSNNPIVYRASLGFDLSTLRHLDALRAVLTGESAKAMEVLLNQLSDLRKQWTQEGRVFARDGLALLIKPAKPEFHPGEPIEFKVEARNESPKVFGLPDDLDQPEVWTLSITDEKGSTFAVHCPSPRKGGTRIPGLDPGKSRAFTISLAGCTFVSKSKGEPVTLTSLPPDTYTLIAQRHYAEAVEVAPRSYMDWIDFKVPFRVAP